MYTIRQIGFSFSIFCYCAPEAKFLVPDRGDIVDSGIETKNFALVESY